MEPSRPQPFSALQIPALRQLRTLGCHVASRMVYNHRPPVYSIQ